MSWAEIKKAVNDNMSTPLSKQLGFQRVAGGSNVSIYSYNSITLSRFTGFLYVYGQPGVTINENDVQVGYVSASSGYCPWTLIPISKNNTYQLNNGNGYTIYVSYLVFALGGVSKTLKKHLYNTFSFKREEVCVA